MFQPCRESYREIENETKQVLPIKPANVRFVIAIVRMRVFSNFLTHHRITFASLSLCVFNLFVFFFFFNLRLISEFAICLIFADRTFFYFISPARS